jgi:multidrug efflux system outer membrane protein
MAAGVILRMAWEIDLWGRLRYGRNAERAMADASSADYRFAQQSIAANVARAWFVATETGRQRQLAQQMADDAGKLVGFAEHRLKIGAGSEDDLLLARNNAASYQDAARQVELAHGQALRALELLLGRYPGATITSRTELPPFPGPAPAGIPVDVLARRPDMLAAEARVDAAFNRVGEAKAAFWPSLSLLFGAGRIESTTNGFGDEKHNTSSASATVVAPIYTGGALTGTVRLRTAEQQQAVADYGRLALQALNEVEDSLNAEHVLESRERILADAVVDSRKRLNLEQHSYRVGKADLREVTQTQLATSALEINLLHVQRERLNQRVGLHLALGGGFAAAPNPEATAGASGTTP